MVQQIFLSLTNKRYKDEDKNRYNICVRLLYEMREYNFEIDVFTTKKEAQINCDKANNMYAVRKSNSNYCVVCGEEIPEGRQICKCCELKIGE